MILISQFDQASFLYKVDPPYLNKKCTNEPCLLFLFHNVSLRAAWASRLKQL